MRILFILTIILLSVVNITAKYDSNTKVPGQIKTYNVSTQGNDNNIGSEAKPFKTLEAARDAIRTYRKKNKNSEEQFIVIIDDGAYMLNKSFMLKKNDSGTENAPIVYKAKNQGKVSFTTAPVLSPDLFRKPNSVEKSRLNKKAVGNVVVAEIDKNLVALFGKGEGDYGALAWNEHILQLAQWPNRGYSILDEVVDIGPTLRWLKKGEKEEPFSFEEPTGGKFTTIEQTNFNAWKLELERTKDIRQDGYLSIDWAKDANQIARVNNDGVIQLLDATRYGIGCVKYRGGFADPVHKPKYLRNRRLEFLNILCELDMPGEWYFDRQENKLYLWPVDKNIKNATIAIPSGPLMVEINQTAYIRFEGFVFENGGDKVVNVIDGNNIEFAGCTFRNLKGKAASVSGSDIGFRSCDFYNMNTCVDIKGGDILTLTRANNYIINCHFHDFRHTGYGAIRFSGCGHKFQNNIYYRISSGISYSGMYIEFKNNEFFDVGWGMGDWNVIYQGANIWCNGNRVENNFFHHMFGHPGIAHPIIAIRNDDGGSGTTYQSNVFYKTGKGSIVAMGPSCHIKDNIAIDCGTIWRTNKRPITAEDVAKEYEDIRVNFESGKYPRGGKEDRIYNAEQVVGEKGWNKEPFKTAFPDFPKYMADNPFAQSYSSVLNSYTDQVDEEYPYNVYYIHGSFQLTEDDGGVHHNKKMEVAFPESFKYNAPRKVLKTDFVDYKSMDFTFKPGFETFPDFQACDMSKIGLYKDEFRPNTPDQKKYRHELYEKNKFRLSEATGLDYPDDAWKYYPVQSWLEDEPYTAPNGYPNLSGMEDFGWVANKGPRRNTNYRGKTISIDGKNYETGISISPDPDKEKSEILFDISEYKQVKGLKSAIAIDESYGRGSCRFLVYIKKNNQWKKIYTSTVMEKGTPVQDFEVEFKGAEMIKLVTEGKATATWINAEFM